MNRKNQIKKLIEQEREIAIKRSKLECKEKVEVNLPILKKSVGRCFKYHNSYGSNYPRWWLYCKIIDISEKDMVFTVVEFQKTSMNQIGIDYDKKFNFDGKFYFDGMNYIEITPKEYRTEANRILKTATELLKQ